MILKFLPAFCLYLLASFACLAAQSELPTYKTSYATLMNLGKDIYNALKPAQKEMVSMKPISMDPSNVPFVQLFSYEDEPKPYRGVMISAGFIDLVNRLAHAKAIDTKSKGYFKKYIELLMTEKGDSELAPLPNDENPAYWSDDILNEQLSNFNSIVGMVVGIKLSHYYLGQYDKYKEKLAGEGSARTPINNLLTPVEWDAALAKGSRNALDGGCTIEGVIPFFEAFDKMAKRPAWTAYFIPDTAKFSKTRKDLEKIQKAFFAGKDE